MIDSSEKEMSYHLSADTLGPLSNRIGVEKKDLEGKLDKGLILDQEISDELFNKTEMVKSIIQGIKDKTKESKVTQESLTSAEILVELFENLVNNNSTLIAVTNKSGKVIFKNKSYNNLLDNNNKTILDYEKEQKIIANRLLSMLGNGKINGYKDIPLITKNNRLIYWTTYSNGDGGYIREGVDVTKEILEKNISNGEKIFEKYKIDEENYNIGEIIENYPNSWKNIVKDIEKKQEGIFNKENGLLNERYNYDITLNNSTDSLEAFSGLQKTLFSFIDNRKDISDTKKHELKGSINSSLSDAKTMTNIGLDVKKLFIAIKQIVEEKMFNDEILNGKDDLYQSQMLSNLFHTENRGNVGYLKQMVNILDQIIRYGPNPMGIYDENGKVVLWNQSMQEYMGFSFKDAIETHEIDLMSTKYGMSNKLKENIRRVKEEGHSYNKIRGKSDPEIDESVDIFAGSWNIAGGRATSITVLSCCESKY